jgi:hypothetical protein
MLAMAKGLVLNMGKSRLSLEQLFLRRSFSRAGHWNTQGTGQGFKLVLSIGFWAKCRAGVFWWDCHSTAPPARPGTPLKIGGV